MTSTILVTAAYIAAQMLADIASLKIIFIFGIAMDAGTLVYPFTFTLRDIAHKVVGKRGTRTLIFAAAIINILMALFFWVVSKLPAATSVGPQADWDSVLAPVWRIVFASIVAEVIAELVDTEIYHLWVTRITRRYQWLRVLVSNAVSIPLDSLIFVLVAFGGVFPPEALMEIFLANLLFKYAFTIISLPWIYLVRERDPEMR
ncbi:MAG: queuosine precursor transporter [Anaerolineales bacterium]|nr:queuosine precursor transporter [Anaerolineales bacterium]